MISKINNDVSPSIYVENKTTVEFYSIRDRLNKIENTHLSLFLPTKNRGIIYQIIEKIKSIFNVEKKIGSIDTARKFNSAILLTDNIREKKVKDLDKITITKEQMYDFIIDYNRNNKSISFNWFVEQYVKTKGDLLLVTKIAYFLEEDKYKFNPLKLITNSSCISNCLPLFNLIITESTNNIKKEIFFNIINDYFDKNKTNFESNEEIKRIDFHLEDSYLFQWSDELKNAFKNIIGNMINKNIDLNSFLEGVIDFKLIDVENYFNHYGTAENYVKALNDTIQQYILNYPRKDECNDECNKAINYLIDNKENINDFIELHLNNIKGDLFMGINKDQYLIRIGQILDVFNEFDENSEK
ncbi:hypothetical protein JEP40_09215 [Proteus vulgaris]|uniref:hypothetical protein n=1 Tax=Proteus vulgaris TaxID=585 RepID=UPI0018E49206|nr:hypothetical protein [Proteus vulgaris]MBI6529293.1 hypothetical protein [Proteus vulgaris]